ncbi:hypothetical protein HMPREF1624_08516 [Sporothrix schenckii ATCC 58251]|uniref:Uncharacterized protein n=1 Tax=Sporothrix schenckii (strain ATCC 58251 / de Perez 2211183) TaxID=1391915 RepID=U7PHM5_SPOS1|nr:hypothetical protein HMPREF1624_08516 [Sporothrix schenckii ATCC 58251]
MHATSPLGSLEAQPIIHLQSFPGREQHIKTLSTLVDPSLAPCGNIVVHGTEATGKSAVTAGVLDMFSSAVAPGAATDAGLANGGLASSLDYAIVDSNKCVTARHLFERTVAKVSDSVRYLGPKARRCETLSQLTVELSNMLQYSEHPENWRFVLVFDAIDRQRDAPATLLPGLARLSEVIPNLTVVFIVTFPSPSMLRTSFVPHIQFGNYSKAEFVEILSRSPPPALESATQEETNELWTRLCTAVHDSLTRTAGRNLPAFQEACTALWPKFTAPILAGTHGPREFSKLLIAARSHFQDESLLDPQFVVAAAPQAQSQSQPQPQLATKDAADSPAENLYAARNLATLLPATARLFLLCAYLASHNATRHDMTLFSTYYHGKKKRRGGMGGGGGRTGPKSKHRKIARKLLGAHSFTLERLMAIFVAVRSEWTRAPPVSAAGRNSAAAIMDSDRNTAIATLASLRLIVRVSGAASDPIDRAGKWRVNVGWEVVRSLGRSMGIEMEDWLID